MAAYITLDEYTQMNGSADAAAFPRLELKARRLIDAATHGRLEGETPVRESVRMCAFELVEMLAAEESAGGVGGREIASVSNDGVSVSYKASDSQSIPARTGRILREWLAMEYAASSVPLLYAGVDG